MKLETTGIRQFSQRVFHYLRSTRPVIVTRRGRPYRVVRPLGVDEQRALSAAGTSTILQHKAIGVWRRRLRRARSSAELVRQMRTQEEHRTTRNQQ